MKIVWVKSSSKRTPNVTYKVTVYGTADKESGARCECMGFRFTKGTLQTKTCKHIEAVR